MAILLFEAGPIAGRRVTVTGELEIGRTGTGLNIDDGEVSRRHALVRPVEGGVEIQDLGSTNGTWVNEVRVEGARRLSTGDMLRIGTSTIRIEADDAVPAVAAEPVVAPPIAADPAPPLPGAPPAPAPAPAPARVPTPVPAVAAAVAAPRFASTGRQRGAATREPIATIVSAAAVVAVAIALVLYFALR